MVSSNGNVKILRLLLERSMTDFRINPAVNQNEPLIKACEKGHTGIVKLLLNHSNHDPRINPGCLDNKPLKLASIYDHLKYRKIINKFLS